MLFYLQMSSRKIEQTKIVMKSCLHAIHNNIFLLIIPNQIALWSGGKIHTFLCQGILMFQAR